MAARTLPAVLALGVVAALVPSAAMAAQPSGEHATSSRATPTQVTPAGSLDYAGGNYSGQNMQGADLHGETHHHTNFRGATLHHAKLHRGVFHHSNFEHAVMHHVTGHHADFSNSSMHHSDFSHSDFRASDFSGSNLRASDMSNSRMHHAKFDGATMHHADMRGTVMPYASMRNTYAHHLNLTGATAHHSKMRGLVAHHSTFIGADLSNSDLRGANLSNSAFSSAKKKARGLNVLSGVANLSGSNATGANLSGSNLVGANLTNMNLTGVDLSGANLTGANLSGSNLTGVNLTGASTAGATLPSAADLSTLCGKAAKSGAGVSLGNMTVTFTRTGSSSSSYSGTITVTGPNGLTLSGTFSCSILPILGSTNVNPMSWSIAITGVSNTFNTPIPGLTVTTAGATGTISKDSATSPIVWSMSLPYSLTKTAGSTTITTNGTMSINGPEAWSLTSTGGSTSGLTDADGSAITGSSFSGTVAYASGAIVGSLTFSGTGTLARESGLLAHLPAGWTASTQMSLDIDKAYAESQAIVAISMNMRAASSSGNDYVSFAGPWSHSGYALTASGQLTVNGTQVAVTGSYDSVGYVVNGTALTQAVWSVTASIANLAIGKGASITSGSVTASNTTPGISGTVTVAPQTSVNFTVTATFAFVSSTNWSLTLTGASSRSQWTPASAPGLTINPNSISGSISRTGSTTTWAISISSLTWTDTKAGITVTTAASLGTACPLTGGLTCGTSAGPYFGFTGATLTFPSPMNNVTAQGALQLDGTWGLVTASPGNFNVNGPGGSSLGLTGASVTVWIGAKPASAVTGVTLPDVSSLSDGIGVEFCGNFNASIPSITTLNTGGCIDWTSSGIVIGQSNVGGSVPAATGSSFNTTGASLGGWLWSNVSQANMNTLPSVQATLGSRVVSMIPATSVFTGTLGLPGSVMKALGQPMVDASVPATLTFAYNGSWHDTDFALSATVNLNVTAGSFTFNTVTFSVAKAASAYSVSFTAAATMTIDGKAYAAQMLLTAATGGGLMFAVTLKGTGTSCGSSCDGISTPLTNPQTGYTYLDNSLFGVPGLHLWAVTVSLSYADGSPAVGFQSTTYIDPTAAPGFKGSTWMTSGTTANISYTNPCLSMGFTSSDPNTYFQIKDGVFQTSTFQIAIAPTGCTVGQTKIGPGISLNITTSLGNNSNIQLQLFFGKDSSNHVTMTANATVTNTTIAGILFKSMSLDVDLTTTSQTVTYEGTYGLGTLGTVYSSFDLSRNGLGHTQMSATACTGTNPDTSYVFNSEVSSTFECPDGTSFGLQKGDLTVKYFTAQLTIDTTLTIFSANIGGQLVMHSRTSTFWGSLTIGSGGVAAFTLKYNYTHGGDLFVFEINYDSSTVMLVGDLMLSDTKKCSHTISNYDYVRHADVTFGLVFKMELAPTMGHPYGTLSGYGSFSGDDISGDVSWTLSTDGSDDQASGSISIHKSSTVKWSETWSW